ncbi:MAG: type III-A CRISPR-associated RAMP protein Csm5 [Chloroflexota bacterium]
MTVYSATIQTISPVHIGDGNTLRQNFDFVTHNGKTWRLNEDEILRTFETQLRPDRAGHYPTPGELVLRDPANFQNPALFRYILQGVARSGKTYAELRSFIKDSQDRPFFPGSSLKGALRTALAWTGWSEVNLRLSRRSDVGNSKSWAARPLEKKLFGSDPNRDLLRALHVADLFGEEKPGGRLLVVNAQVLTPKNTQSPIELEALPGDVTFKGSITVDETLFAPFADRELGFGNRRHWLEELTLRAQKHSQARIAQLADWFEHADQNYHLVARFYRELSAASLPTNQALLQVGWGSGWDGKTFGSHLQADEYLFEQLVADFRMHKAGKDSPPRKPGDAFPRSKRAAMRVKDGVARAVAPFGWVLLTLEK